MLSGWVGWVFFKDIFIKKEIRVFEKSNAADK